MKLFLEEVNLTMKQEWKMTKEELKKHMINWDEGKWREEVNSRTSIKV